jgi:hypothetical protein
LAGCCALAACGVASAKAIANVNNAVRIIISRTFSSPGEAIGTQFHSTLRAQDYTLHRRIFITV